MKRKFSTVLEKSLLRRLKLESAREGRPMSEMVGEALESYLSPTGEARREKGKVVESTWGSLALDRETLKDLMSEEESLLDS